jgi:hypothetical protein
MKKWFCLLLALGFSFTNVYAADDDEDWEEWEEEEEEAPKKKSKKAKKAKSDAESRVGLSIGFGGNGDIRNNVVSLVYDTGSGIEIGLGVGLDRETTEGVGWQNIIIVPGLKYNLGKGLLDYGLGVSLHIVKEEEVMPITGFPYFYISAELVKNLSLNLDAGVSVHKREEFMRINFATRGIIAFYFM